MQVMPTCLVGVPGIGKTTVLQKVAANFAKQRENCDVIKIPLIGAAYEDILGIPWPLPDDNVFIYKHPYWLKKLVENDHPNILLLDEISRLDERMQNVVGKLLDREAGEFQIPKTVMIAMTMNPSGGGVYPLNENLLTRIAFYEAIESRSRVPMDLVRGFPEIEVEYLKQEDIEKHYAKWRLFFANMCQCLPGAFRPPDKNANRVGSIHYTLPIENLPTDDSQLGDSLPAPYICPRSRDNMIRALAAADAAGFSTDYDHRAVVAAICGDEFATNFEHHVFAVSAFPVDKILEAIKNNKIWFDASHKNAMRALILGWNNLLEYALGFENAEDRKQILWKCARYLGTLEQFRKENKFPFDTATGLTSEILVYLAYSILSLDSKAPIPSALLTLLAESLR